MKYLDLSGLEHLISKLKILIDGVITSTATNTTSIGTLDNLTTASKNDLVGAINEIKAQADIEVIQKYNVVTAVTNGDYKINIGNITSGNVVKVSFPSAIDKTKVARLSVDNGTTYKNIYMGGNLLASTVENKGIELKYNGTQFEPMCAISDTNTRGKWTKFPDGTMHQQIFDYSFTSNCTLASGNIWRSEVENVTLPLAFIDSAFTVSVGISSYVRWGNAYGSGTGTVRLTEFSPISGSTYNARVVAEGRWK